MPAFNRASNPETAFVQAIMKQIKEQLPTSFVIPVYQNDPPESNPTNLWMRTDGRLRGRYWDGTVFQYVDYPSRADLTSPPAVPVAPAVPARPTAPVSHRSTYTATWSQSYAADGTPRTDTIGATYLVYGNDGTGDAYGTQRSLVGFDYDTIMSDLSGSTIKTIELTMTNIEAYWASGADVYFGMHDLTAEPASYPASTDLYYRRATSAHYGAPETKTINLPSTFAQALRSGIATGLAIEAPTSSVDYYGYAAGVGSGYTPPQLTISYAK